MFPFIIERMFEFKILKKYNKAREGIFHTPHGNLHTPELAFVATEGEIKGIPKKYLKQLPVNLVIVNTFHLWVKYILNPFHLRGAKDGVGTIHRYMDFGKTIMSDSGGFQVFSMGFGKSHGVGKIGGMFPGHKISKTDSNNPIEISEKGVKFAYDNKSLILTPELSIELQRTIGADIIFAFDECTSPLNSKQYTKNAMERTHRWLKRCINTLKKDNKSRQALFGIIQGGRFRDLREISAKFVSHADIPGFGIGGSLGKTKKEMLKILEWTIPLLPDKKPRHLLGIGQIRDIFEAVERGVDLFDCVIPTREARHRVLYTKHGKIQLRKMKHNNDVLEKGCACIACRKKITYSQLMQLFTDHDPKAFYYATAHNIRFYANLMSAIRDSIAKNTFDSLKKQYFSYY